MYAIRSYYDTGTHVEVDVVAVAVEARIDLLRITSYNVCYTKLLRDLLAETVMDPELLEENAHHLQRLRPHPLARLFHRSEHGQLETVAHP